MSPSVASKRFLVMLGGSIVAAAVVTLVLATPTTTSAVLTFAVVMVAGVLLSYAIGYLGIPSDSTAYPMSGRTSNPPDEPTDAGRRDAADFMWTLREGIGVAIASLFGLLLLALFMLEQTGIVDGPGVAGELAEWAVFLVLALTVLVLGVWSWRGRDWD